LDLVFGAEYRKSAEKSGPGKEREKGKMRRKSFRNEEVARGER